MMLLSGLHGGIHGPSIRAQVGAKASTFRSCMPGLSLLQYVHEKDLQDLHKANGASKVLNTFPASAAHLFHDVDHFSGSLPRYT